MQHSGIMCHCDGMQVHDRIEAVSLTLQVGPLVERAQDISDMKRVGGRLDTRENPRLRCHGASFAEVRCSL